MIESLVLSFTLILARVGAFVAVLPLLGGSATPRTVKAGLAAALAVFYFVSVEGGGWRVEGDLSPPPSTLHPPPEGWLALGLVLSREVLLGTLLGFVMGLVLLPVRIAGDYLGQEMGLSLATQADPTAADSSQVVSQLFQMLAGLLFFGLNGHHLFLAALHGTFQSIPIGGSLLVPSFRVGTAASAMTAGLSSAHQWGLLLAAPAGALLFLSSTVLALMTRTTPQMNLFSVGFGLRIAIGLGALFLFMPDFVAALERCIAHMSALLERLV